MTCDIAPSKARTSIQTGPRVGVSSQNQAKLSAHLPGSDVFLTKPWQQNDVNQMRGCTVGVVVGVISVMTGGK